MRGRELRKKALRRYYLFVVGLTMAMALSVQFPVPAYTLVFLFIFSMAAAAVPAIRANRAFAKQQYGLAALYADQAVKLNLYLYPASTWTIGHMVDLQMRQHVQQGNNAQIEAIGKLIWSLTERKETDFASPTKSAWAANYVALAYLGQRRYEEAIKLFKLILMKERKPDHRGVLVNNLGYAYFRNGQLEEAERELREGLVYCKKPRSPMQKRIAAHIKSNLGRTLLLMGKLAEAEQLLDECFAERERDKALPHEMAESHRGIAELREKQGRNEEAELYYRNAIGLYRQFFASHHYIIAETMDSLAALLDKTGKTEEAQKTRQEAEFIRYEHDDNEQQSLMKVLAAFNDNKPMITMLS